jgi:hypothetical protein
MEKYTKISDAVAEVETTIIEKKEVGLDQLIYDRDSLMRTQTENTQNAISANAEIQSKIDILDTRINELKNIGIKTAKEIKELNPAEIVIETPIITKATSTEEIIN